MKIYEDSEEYLKNLVFWSSDSGDLIDEESRPIDEEELPEEFKSFNYEDYYLVDGMYSWYSFTRAIPYFPLYWARYEYIPSTR